MTKNAKTNFPKEREKALERNCWLALLHDVYTSLGDGVDTLKVHYCVISQNVDEGPKNKCTKKSRMLSGSFFDNDPFFA